MNCFIKAATHERSIASFTPNWWELNRCDIGNDEGTIMNAPAMMDGDRIASIGTVKIVRGM